MRDLINVVGGLAIFFIGLGWLATGGGVIALLVMLGGGYGASQASIRRNARLDQERQARLARVQHAAGQRLAMNQAAVQGQLPPGQGVNPNCGHTLSLQASFCSICGAPTPNAPGSRPPH